MPDADIALYLMPVVVAVNVAVPMLLCYRAARCKGRSGKWALAGLAHILGVIYVAFLEPGIREPSETDRTTQKDAAARSLGEMTENTGVAGANPKRTAIRDVFLDGPRRVVRIGLRREMLR